MLGLAVRLGGFGWQWIKRNPLLCLCLILALWGAWERSGRLKALDQRDQCRTASQAAAAQTKAMRKAELIQSKEKADNADRSHRTTLAAARVATDAYLARRRVQPSGNLSTPAAVDQAGNPADAAPVSSAVIMDTADVQTCGDLYAWSVTAHDWIASVGQ